MLRTFVASRALVGPDAVVGQFVYARDKTSFFKALRRDTLFGPGLDPPVSSANLTSKRYYIQSCFTTREFVFVSYPGTVYYSGFHLIYLHALTV